MSELYPSLIDKKDMGTSPNEENIELNKSRIKLILEKKHNLEKDLNHYKKLKRKYNFCYKGIKYIGFGITGVVSVASIILLPSVGLVAVPVLTSIFSGVSVGTAVFTPLILKIQNVKQRKYRNKCKILEINLSKLSYYFEKIRDDKIITLEEYEGYMKLVENLNDKLKKNDLLHQKEVDKLEKKAKNEVRQEAIQHHYDKLVEKYKKNLQ